MDQRRVLLKLVHTLEVIFSFSHQVSLELCAFMLYLLGSSARQPLVEILHVVLVAEARSAGGRCTLESCLRVLACVVGGSRRCTEHCWLGRFDGHETILGRCDILCPLHRFLLVTLNIIVSNTLQGLLFRTDFLLEELEFHGLIR